MFRYVYDNDWMLMSIELYPFHPVDLMLVQVGVWIYADVVVRIRSWNPQRWTPTNVPPASQFCSRQGQWRQCVLKAGSLVNWKAVWCETKIAIFLLMNCPYKQLQGVLLYVWVMWDVFPTTTRCFCLFEGYKLTVRIFSRVLPIHSSIQAMCKTMAWNSRLPAA